jgi:uncharacterized protein YjbJ (UPF0337 family)
MNKDQIKGHVEEAKGKAKEAVGIILDDKDLETEGVIEKNIGKVKSALGDLKEEVKKHIDDI